MKSYLFPLLWIGMFLSLHPTQAQTQTQKPPLHGKDWMAITGKPLAATAGAMTFQRGGNAVDAACAMLGAVCTMWDMLGWGGETQALIYHPGLKKVIAINAMGVAPSGATVDFFQEKGMAYPPEFGPLAATTPGTPGGLIVMLAEYGTLSLEEVLAPAMDMAKGYPIEAHTANMIEGRKEELKKWPYSRAVMLPHLGEEREAPYPGEIFVQETLSSTLQKLVDTEKEALAAGKSRKEALYAAFDRFYKGDIAEEIVRSVQEQGGLFQLADLATYEVKIEEPLSVTYKGIEVYKMQEWTQGPVLLQALNLLEEQDLQGMGYNSARYLHTLYQAMNMAFADRDFYYGDPAFEPKSPMKGLLSKAYARERMAKISPVNDPHIGPGDPYPFQGEQNPFLDLLSAQEGSGRAAKSLAADEGLSEKYLADFHAGTTTIQAADKEGWVVSITPSGGWVPATIAGTTGIGLSQRMQSFVLDRTLNPFNVLEPGKRPRVTLTPSMALKDGEPFLSFAVQGGDSQDQNLLQFFLNMVEFDMTVQEAAEAANMNSYQMRSSFGAHERKPGRMTLQQETPPWVRKELQGMGYRLDFVERSSGPINAIWFDRKHGTLWGGSSHHGEDYGIAW
ncbi:gamma-glutamyltransferase [Nitritalea halalkaliphila LW7]|uniref:Gamma-glutamyltransferase n=2 Tax=Nitritalea TaxID=1187887 RepID=I5CAQ2_9BACT|nr:gamma-glutamyltransferase [Nitritalea halalkaliphila LW7]